MRKILCLTLAFLCILSLSACGASPASVSSPEVQQTLNPFAETPVAVEPQTPAPAASTPDSAEPVSLGLDGLVSIDSFSFPSRYDLREIGLVTEVKDQGPYLSAWKTPAEYYAPLFPISHICSYCLFPPFFLRCPAHSAVLFHLPEQ